jgi:hypothetical protein
MKFEPTHGYHAEDQQSETSEMRVLRRSNNVAIRLRYVCFPLHVKFDIPAKHKN